MELEIMPEPPPDEREAVERALARLLEESPDPWSAWWRAGVLENLTQAEAEPA
jgi:hypothetical protein